MIGRDIYGADRAVPYLAIEEDTSILLHDVVCKSGGAEKEREPMVRQ